APSCRKPWTTNIRASGPAGIERAGGHRQRRGAGHQGNIAVTKPIFDPTSVVLVPFPLKELPNDPTLIAMPVIAAPNP
ncbi:hypothetical protein, partial [Acidocella aminolytica]